MKTATRITWGGRAAIWLLAALLLTGCGAAYSGEMRGALRRVGNRDYEGALAKIEKPGGKTNKVLYRLERGLIFHYEGQYARSNQEFEKAETLIDELFARSVSREAAALLTNDAIRAYRGEEYERVMIHYYRALNYQYLGEPEEALVECRKANLKLEDYAQQAETRLTYRNDAFVQYVTGMLYQAAGEWNDAYVSYRNAEKGYASYQSAFGVPMPRPLAADLARTAARLGFDDDRQAAVTAHALTPQELAAGGAEVMVFAETGFVARKHQYEISLPILEDDDTGNVWVTSGYLVDRYHQGPLYRPARVKYWLRLALPEYKPVPSRIRSVRVTTGGRRVNGVLVEDLDAIALKVLAEKQDEILLRTGARALSKYLAAQGVEKLFERDEDRKSKDDDLAWKGVGAFMGILANLFGAATEAADTRGWLSLPARIHMARVSLPPGVHDLTLEFLDERGQTVEVHAFPGVTVTAGRPVFLSYRSYH